MNTIIMNQDVHTPAFIKADASNKTDKDKQQPTLPKQVRRFGWTRFIELEFDEACRLDTLHRTRNPAFHRYRRHLAYLEDSNATGRNCRVSYCRFSDTTLYSQGNSESGIYAAEHSLLAGDCLCHPVLRALRSTAL